MRGTSRVYSSRLALALAYAVYCAAVFVVAFALAEAIARWRGAEAWQPRPAALSVTPGGRLYEADPQLAFLVREGHACGAGA